VLVGLIGSGQEIHVGEEAGLGQWRTALERAGDPGGWTVHAPEGVLQEFFGPRAAPAARPGPSTSSTNMPTLRQAAHSALELTVELRFHFADDLDRWVDGLLTDDREWPDGEHTARNAALAAHGRELAAALERDGYHLRMTRDLELAKTYLHQRYLEDPEARYGLVASSRDKLLEPEWGVPNGWHSTQRLQVGPWYGEGDGDPRSCRRLTQCVTEFQAQGLELDAVLLAWGLDLIRADEGGGERWTDAHAKRHARGSHVRDPYQLRINAYRVMLTRGRDGATIFVPPDPRLDLTATWLQGHGVKMLG
jgi:DUF2075 family protein